MNFSAPLKRGDVVRVIAPASGFDRPTFEQGLAILTGRLGLVPRFRDDLFAKTGYLAGGDDRRVAEFDEAVADREARAIWCVRGGYGVMRILPRLDLDGLVRSKKLFAGFSDLTAVHLALNARGLASLHGPMVCSIARAPEPALAAVEALVRGGPPGERAGQGVIRAGRASGRLMGGNLALLAHLCGTPWLPSLEGAVLLVEDVTEKPYRLDRYLTQLELAGALRGIAGVAVGELVQCDDKDGLGLDAVVERLARLGVPAIHGLQVGHDDLNLAVPLGARVTLEADPARPRLVLEEGAVA